MTLIIHENLRKTRQGNTTQFVKAVIFSKKNWLPRVGFESITFTFYVAFLPIELLRQLSWMYIYNIYMYIFVRCIGFCFPEVCSTYMYFRAEFETVIHSEGRVL